MCHTRRLPLASTHSRNSRVTREEEEEEEVVVVVVL
jgi:hypothetical protein